MAWPSALLNVALVLLMLEYPHNSMDEFLLIRELLYSVWSIKVDAHMSEEETVDK